MITYLNDRDWLLRHAFFESIVDVAACAGGRSLEEYILPLMIQALSGKHYVMHMQRLLIYFFDSRCRRDCRCEGPRLIDQFMRTRSIPEDAYLGADECNPWLFVPSKYVDTPR